MGFPDKRYLNNYFFQVDTLLEVVIVVRHSLVGHKTLQEHDLLTAGKPLQYAQSFENKSFN